MENRKLQVFISSTYTDLKEERQVAVQAVLRSGNIPAGMELFKADDKSQMAVIDNWIDQSDVYLLILGGRYGSLDKESNKSYTQLEYEYALSKQTPVFAIVLSDKFLQDKANKTSKETIYEQQNRTLYNNFKDQVTSKMVEFASDAKDIRSSILAKMYDFKDDKKLIGWIRTNEVEQNSSLLRTE
ncbi:DUF4062 domain-containing protein [Oenococcus kitaharae]|uniref:Serine/threonine kinase n=1 Tax=Oenococcus kitaharae DSM 17330 TaxID=1045004 RepID=G9WHP0_9LACO|nr:DUF4062 domain-containing protein [Oenococcus kitaharae]EHN58614.1 serine/threonine kinase [Oenococcus kitaharae DSM 17330]